MLTRLHAFCITIETCFFLLPVVVQHVFCDDFISAVGIYGQSHTFKCNLLASDSAVQWYDNVYNMEEGKAALIFDGNQNGVNQAHPISARLSINEEGSLTISDLESDDAGEYFCQSTVDGETQTENYQLTLGGKRVILDFA